MKYLKQFATTTEYTEYINGDTAILPNVSICEDTPNFVGYNPYVAPPIQPNDEIWYTSTDNDVKNFYEDWYQYMYMDEGVPQVVIGPYWHMYDENFLALGAYVGRYEIPIGEGEFYFGANMVSNTYKDGKGIIKFDRDITRILEVFINSFGGGFNYISIPNSVIQVSFGSSTDNFPVENGIKYTSLNTKDNICLLDVDNTELQSYSIKNGTKFINSNAFVNCSLATSITIPGSVVSIGSYAFDCENLTSLTCLATTPPILLDELGTNEFQIYVPAEAVEAYKTATNWICYADRIQAIP